MCETHIVYLHACLYINDKNKWKNKWSKQNNEKSGGMWSTAEECHEENKNSQRTGNVNKIGHH